MLYTPTPKILRKHPMTTGYLMTNYHRWDSPLLTAHEPGKIDKTTSERISGRSEADLNSYHTGFFTITRPLD